MKHRAADFQKALERRFAFAEGQEKWFLDVNSGDLHREIGGYPASAHAMPTCCNVMQRNMAGRDAVLSSPPKGRGATFTIRYELPRNCQSRLPGAANGKV
jgi:5-methylcytosine-specific restriction protein A